MKLNKGIPAPSVQNVRESIDFYTTRLGFSAPHQDDDFAIMVW
jgi:catechol 2,3-dioxygenase-like lactoylglutathione lyase family enzyme